MSPEINGNPPSVTKRKKNRDKKPSLKVESFDLNMPNCNYFPTANPTTNFRNHNLSFPDISAYYSFLNYTSPSEPMSLPVYPMNYPNYPSYPNGNLNFSSTPKATMMHNITSINGDTTEYLSLPMVNLEQNDDESSKRRFSDPGLPNDSDSSANSVDSRLIQKLTQQVNVLKDNNRKLSRDVMDLRLEVNMLKQQQGRHYERDYEPGMLTDLIREVRDAARVREDALLARVRHMIEEKQVSVGHMHLVSEKNRNNDRITKLEEQLKTLSINRSRTEDNVPPSSSSSVNITEELNNSARQVLELEREALELRRELQDARAKKEEADQKLIQLDKKLSSILRRNDILNSEILEDAKNASSDTMTTTSSISHVSTTPRVTLSGPVTDL